MEMTQETQEWINKYILPNLHLVVFLIILVVVVLINLFWYYLTKDEKY